MLIIGWITSNNLSITGNKAFQILSATNEDLRKTQVLLQQARLEEECYMKNNGYSNPQWGYIEGEYLTMFDDIKQSSINS